MESEHQEDIVPIHKQWVASLPLVVVTSPEFVCALTTI